jgi:hypothetical protein
MPSKRLAFPLLFLCTIACSGIASAESRDLLWKAAADAERLSLPRTAIDRYREIERGALRDRAIAEAARAKLLRLRDEARIEGDPESFVVALETELRTAPREMRPLLEVALARSYWRLFEGNRWRILNRSRVAGGGEGDIATWDAPRFFAVIDSHFTLALSDPATLQSTPIATLDALLIARDVNDAYRPTVYDFVAHEAIAFLASDVHGRVDPTEARPLEPRGPIFGDRAAFLAWREGRPDESSVLGRAIRLYQELLRFHEKDPDSTALLDVDLERLRFGWNFARGKERDSLYLGALGRFADRERDHPASASARADWSTRLEQVGRKLEAWTVARVGADRFPESLGGRACYNTLRRIEEPELTTMMDRVWGASSTPIRVTYANIERVCFRLLPLDYEDRVVRKGRGYYDFRDEELLSLVSEPPVRAWSQAVPKTTDFRPRSEDVRVPPDLAPGWYVLLACDGEDFAPSRRRIYVSTIWVSRLALVARPLPQGRADGLVVDIRNGAPLPGAQVRSWQYDGRSSLTAGPTTTTDADGHFDLPAAEQGTHVLVTRGDQRLGTNELIRGSHAWGDARNESTLLFTDRGLYRPGQSIHYAGVAITVQPSRDRYEAIARRTIVVGLFDASGQETERATLESNDYGSFGGTFTAPRESRIGAYQVRVVSGPEGEASIAVEEYKRPKFSVAIDAPSEPAELGARIRVPGRAVAYTGAPIDGAVVRWRVTRAVFLPLWWRARFGWPGANAREREEIAQGTTKTDAEGRFELSFDASPDPSYDAAGEPVFVFSVHADVVDATGEMRSEDRLVRVGYTTMQASMTVDEWQTIDRPVEFSLRTSSLDGAPRPARGRIVVERLHEPEEVTPSRDTQPEWGSYLDREAFPLESRPRPMDSTDPATWPAAEVVAERSVSVADSGRVRLSFRLPTGHYRARFEAPDANGKPVRAESVVRVLDVSRSASPFRIPNLFAARAWSVEVGDEFLGVWGSGYPDARAYVEVLHREAVVQKFWTAPGRTQVAIHRRVTPEMRGGFRVRVTMVHDGQVYAVERNVEVPWTDRRLDVTWERLVSDLRPGKRETWTAVVRGADRRARPAEMVATLYDASLDALRPFDWPGWASFFRTDQSWGGSETENRRGWFYRSVGNWPIDRKAAERTDRTYPPELLPETGYRAAGSAVHVSAQRLLDSSVDGLSAGVVVSGALSSRAAESEELAIVTQATGIANRPGAPGQGAHEPTSPLRRNLGETAFFFPQLRTDADGVIRIEFTMPEALTEWRFLGFAHDPDLGSGRLEARARTSLDLMVQPNPPRFLREGDVIEFPVKVVNRTDGPRAGRVRLELEDAITGARVDGAFGNSEIERGLSIPARESRTVVWRLTVPDGAGPLVYRAIATSGDQSDGEESALPVLSRRVFVTESIPLAIRGPASKDVTFAHLAASAASSTLRHEGLTLQIASNPAWYAVLALPSLTERTCESTDRIFHRLYANALAAHVANSDPRIRTVFEQWRATPALDSPLEKNDDLKSVVLAETPWVREARSESQQRRDVGRLFDPNWNASERASAFGKLASLQDESGQWPWFPGCPPSRQTTLSIVAGFARLKRLGVDVDLSLARRAVETLDVEARTDFERIRARGRQGMNHLTPSIALYLYARGLLLADRPVRDDLRASFDFWLGQARTNWPKLASRQAQALVALALERFDDHATPRAIVRSLSERARHDDEFGMSWADAAQPWCWYDAPIETQAAMIELFEDVAHDPTAVDDLKVWLVKQKQTQAWPSARSTAEAVYALVLRGTSALASRALVEVSLGGTPVRPEDVEAGTGFYAHRVAGADVAATLARVHVEKRDSGVAWGGLHWQYFEDASKVPSAEGPGLGVRRSLFVRRAGPKGKVLEPVRGVLHVGDELVSRIELRTNRLLEFVHVKEGRGSGTEPTSVESGYRWSDGLGTYEETRDTATHWYIESLPPGTYVFETSSRVQLRGRYRTGLTEAECLYAPEFNSRAASVELTVE